MRCRRSVLVLSAVLTLLMAISAVAYAVTEGRIVENLKVFLDGRECVSVVTENEDGTYRIPVSYTHLDVYKRQVTMCLLRQN